MWFHHCIIRDIFTMYVWLCWWYSMSICAVFWTEKMALNCFTALLQVSMQCTECIGKFNFTSSLYSGKNQQLLREKTSDVCRQSLPPSSDLWLGLIVLTSLRCDKQFNLLNGCFEICGLLRCFSSGTLSCSGETSVLIWDMILGQKTNTWKYN